MLSLYRFNKQHIFENGNFQRLFRENEGRVGLTPTCYLNYNRVTEWVGFQCLLTISFSF